MNVHRLALLGLSLPLVAIACAAPASDEPTAAGTQDMTAAWLQSNIPSGSVLEAKVLALVNDSTMTVSTFQSECGYSSDQAANLIAYRRGDDLLAASDDQRFDNLAELDSVPFTDSVFWANTVRCAILHTAGPGVCAPGSHPPVIVELVVDESGSMNGEKWAATRDALLGLYGRFQTAADPNVLVGTQLFDDSPTTKVKPKPVTDEQLDDLTSLVDKPSPHGGGTGIQKALDAAIRTADAVPGASQAGARRIVVLVSDGTPSGGEQEQRASLDLVAKAHADGVEVYAVGIGEFPSSNPGSYNPGFMGRVALAGGTAPASCDPDATDAASVCHVQITPSATLATELSDALETIRNNTVQTCP
ncbi:MAG: vWA domain-containing protein [Labilithrix sp.]